MFTHLHTNTSKLIHKCTHNNDALCYNILCMMVKVDHAQSCSVWPELITAEPRSNHPWNGCLLSALCLELMLISPIESWFFPSWDTFYRIKRKNFHCTCVKASSISQLNHGCVTSCVMNCLTSGLCQQISDTQERKCGHIQRVPKGSLCLLPSLL